MTEKKCSRCGEVKPIAKFGRKRTRKDGLQSRCKVCKRQEDIEYRAAHPETQIEANRRWRAREDPEKRRERMRRYRANNPEKNRAHWLVTEAVIDGKLIRPDECEDCGGPNPQAHHDDYSKPYEVRWLCPSCHAAQHKENADALS